MRIPYRSGARASIRRIQHQLLRSHIRNGGCETVKSTSDQDHENCKPSDPWLTELLNSVEVDTDVLTPPISGIPNSAETETETPNDDDSAKKLAP